MSITPKRTEAPSLEVVRESNYFPIHGGWVWRECLVRLTDGTVAVYDIPQYPVGGAR
jgi:hypothetical protein